MSLSPLFPRLLRSAVLIASLQALAGTAFAQHADHDAIHGCGKADALAQLFETGLDPSGNSSGDIGPREAMTDTDVLNNFLDIEIVPGTSNISGSNTMTIKSLVNGLSQFTFMLRSNYTISDIKLNSVTTLTATSVGTYGRRVTFPTPFNTGDTFTLKVTYGGTALSRGFGSIEFQTQSGTPIVCSLSEPYYAGTWWPVKDGDVLTQGDNSDKATLDMWVTAPSNLVTISNGLLQGTDVLTGSRKRYRWRTNYQTASYLACFSSTNYNTWSTTYTFPLTGGGTGTMPVQFYIYPASDNAGNRAAWEKCTSMLAAYRPIYGEYPFINEKYGIYQFVFGGGMEHQTMTGQGTFSETVTAHELGHQWWGDNVTCRTWGDIWLNEGFATYTQALWEEFKSGGSAAARNSFMANSRPNTSTGSVYRYDVSNANAIFASEFAYNKGSWVLHMLRHACGNDTTFWSLLAAHRATHQGGAASTDTYANVCSGVLGHDMQPFFDAWVYGQGAPTYVYSSSTQTLGSTTYLKLRLRQTQAAPAAAVFPMPVDVRLTRGAVTSTYVVNNNAASQYFVIPLTGSGTVSAPTIDPDVWILNGGKTSEAWAAGPAALVAASPAPGTTVSLGTNVTFASLTFSENIAANTANFIVTYQGVGPIPFTYSYAAGTQTATLSFAGSLAPGAYTITTTGSILANGQDLDGEMTGNTLPSGNGIAGGEIALSFTVPQCPADFNSDGAVDFFDYDDFVMCFEGGVCPPGSTADFNHDTAIDFFDYDDFVVAFETPC